MGQRVLKRQRCQLPFINSLTLDTAHAHVVQRPGGIHPARLGIPSQYQYQNLMSIYIFMVISRDLIY